MARGGRKTPPPPNRTPIVTRSRSQDNIPPQTATTSTEDPHITVEPATPNPTGGDIQEIFRQSLIKSHKAFASLRQPHRPWSQPLDFSEVRDQLGDIDTTVNPTDSNPVAGGSGIPPSPPPSPPPSSPSSGGDSSSDEGNPPSRPPTPTTPMANQNNPARPWLDQDAVAVPGPQHPLPKHPEKWLTKFDPDSKRTAEDHIMKFMLDIRLRNVEHEDVVCRLFPYTFEGNASTWYFAQQPHTITSWEKFESIFLEKFGDGKPPEVLVMDLSSLKMNAKEKVKDFNQRFLTLKNRIPTDSMPAESLVIAYYTKALHQSIAIWVKRSKKATLVEAFEEATQIEKDILSLKDSSSNETETASSSKKKIEILPRPTQNKTQPENSELESLTKAVQKLSNQVVDIKRSTEEATSSKGPYKPPFRRPFQTNRPNSNPEGMNLENLQYALQSILGAQDDLIPPDFPQEEVEQETTQEEEPSTNVFGHLSDSIFQANFETVHPYNTRSKAANKLPADNITALSSKTSKPVETKQINASPKLDYDVVEDLKKLRANISIYELLKFPFLLQTMLQNISDNSKNGNLNNSKVGQSKVPQKSSTKGNSDSQDKGSLPVSNVNNNVNNVNNSDKIVVENASKKPQATTLNTRKNVPPFLLTFEIFNRNVHNCMVDSGASSNVMPWSVCQKINAEVEPSSLKIIQLDRTDVKVMGELKNVLIRLSSNPKVHQFIDIIVVDIPEVYGMFLSRDWSEQLHGYFATDWSHLWLPENGKPNKIRVNRERYLKFTVTDLNDPNEPYTPPANSPEAQGVDTYFGNFTAEVSPISDPQRQSEIKAFTQPTASIQKSCEPDQNQVWSLYFDGSKSKEGAGAGCIIIDPAGNKTLLACRLEFECTNNVAEYEALLQGLRKALDMRIQNLIVFGDSEIVVRQVRNSIHCLTPHLKCYQYEVWNLINKFSAFNINSIPRSSNVEADLLANVASKLLPADGLSPNAFSVELLFRPSIPDNITNWRVFNDDHQIINFLHMEETFRGAVIDEQTHEDDLHDFTVIPNPKPPESEMVNSLPNSVVRLEKFYDFEDKFKKTVNCKTNSSSLHYEKVNLGTNDNPQYINLGLGCSKHEKVAFIRLFKEFKDVFAWTYEDLKTFDPNIIQHVIPMKPQTLPFQQKLRKMHPKLEPTVQKELNKLLSAKIIFPVRHTQWVSNLVPVRKKNGEIRLCVDFRNLNKASEKDNYPVPPMEQILQQVSGSERLSLLDGFSGYNQVLMSPSDQLKTTFRTPWGTYAYRKMPFGLINAGATFQRAMDIAFRGLINHSVVVYLDDVTVYSKNKNDHLAHLRVVLLRCRKYGISLNPKKSIFAVEQGKLLGFIVSSDGMIIDPERTQVIAKLPPPTSKKSMQSFLGQINFVRRFVPSFSEMVRPLQKLIKKDTQYHWGPTENQAFNDIKKAIIDAPSLMSPDFSKDFTLYTFASDRSYAAVLTQKNSEDNEVPIAFMSSAFKGAELNYPTVDQQAYAVFKAVKHFRSYLLKSRTKVIVPYPAVRNLLVQKELGEKRANWVTSLQEFDLEITPAQIVRGQGLCKLVVDSEIDQKEDNDMSCLEQNDQNLICCTQNFVSPWYDDIRHYLQHGSAPRHLDPAKRRALRLKSASFHLINGILFRQNFDGILMRCLEKDEAEKVLLELHAGEAGGHFGGDTTAHKVLRAGYYWPTLFRDAHALCRKCIICQKASGRLQKPAFPLQPVTVDSPFQQWGLDIIGPINPPSSQQHKYIVTATDYFTRWSEAAALKTVNTTQVIAFLNSHIITRFGIPDCLVFDNASYFSSLEMSSFALEKGIKLKYSASYYPQGNGLAESTNKNLIKIIKRTVAENHKNWHNALLNALWADRVTPKAAVGNSPFFLVYGREAILPPHVLLPSLQLSQRVQEEECPPLENRINALMKLEEVRTQAKYKLNQHQQLIKSWFDSSSASDRNFETGDLVLKWDKPHEGKGEHTKFQNLWLGPFLIAEKLGPSSFRLQNLEGQLDTYPVNGQALKRYFA
jgi:ribonuclease HI/transposase InsO family protein